MTKDSKGGAIGPWSLGRTPHWEVQSGFRVGYLALSASSGWIEGPVDSVACACSALNPLIADGALKYRINYLHIGDGIVNWRGNQAVSQNGL